MTTTTDGEDRFADLVDDALEQVLAGDPPDAAALAARHPQVRHRVAEALALASSLAGRKVTARPTLQGYEIVRELGRGGMGTVYLARQAALDREVAIKVLPHSFGLSAHRRQRFLEEARALARVRHEHIVDIHRVVDDGELLAFEMEFVDGPSLQSVLDRMREHREATGRPPELEVVADALGLPPAALPGRTPVLFFVQLAAKVARALAAVHRAGFVHRDVKPANILLDGDGEPVLVDFGLVRLHDLEVSHPGQFAGTPVYSAPEQLRGDPLIGPTADVYGLGVTLYECLTLARPFAGRTTTDLLQFIERGRLVPVRQLAPSVPRDLETIVHHAMDPDAGQRYANAGALADDLQRLLDLRPIEARRASPLKRAAKLLRRNRQTLFAAGCGALLVGALLVPLLQQVRASARDREQAAAHVHEARRHLIRIDGVGTDWGQAARGALAQQRGGGGEDDEREAAPLVAAAELYDRAAALQPLDPAPARERRVVRLARWLRGLTVREPDAVQRALASDEFADLTRDLGPATVAAARRLAGAPGDAAGEAEPTSADDRVTLGLLAYLLGDFRRCESSWGAVADVADDPLVAAGLGRLLLADGRYESAYARLQQAQQSFPDATILTAELADTALHLGELTLARRCLEQLPEGGDDAPRRERLALDLRAATEPGADLTDEYRAVAARAPSDPTPRLRLAQLAQRRGDLDEASARLDELIVDWPRTAALRLLRARIALLQRDLPAYGRQVREVLAQDYGAGRSRGAVADLLEVLRLGGLERLYLEGVRATGQETAGRATFGDVMPVRAFAPPLLGARFEEFAALLDGVERRSAALRTDLRRMDDVSAAALLTLPQLLATLPVSGPLGPRAHLLLRAVPLVAPTAYDALQPFVRGALLELGVMRWRPIMLEAILPPAAVEPPANFGHRLLRVPDATGDGLDDLLVAAPVPDPADGTGHVTLIDGRSRACVRDMPAETAEHLFAHVVAVVGDLDGDGRDDWLFGCPSGATDQKHGRVELRSSATGAVVRALAGDEPGYGASLCGLDDCDGDGVADFAVGSAPLLVNRAAQGRVEIVSGRTFETIRSMRNDGPGVWFAAMIAATGDADGDGVSDLVVGGNFGGAPGLVRLYSAATGRVLHTWSNAAAGVGFGAFVGAAGDVDGDGRADVVVSATDAGKSTPDEVFFFSGATGDTVAVLRDTRPGTGFGSAVVRYGRSTTGGAAMFVIGAPRGGDPVTGVVQLCSVDGTVLTSIVGPNLRGSFGWALATGPDLDGDGLPEVFTSGTSTADAGLLWRVRSTEFWLPGRPR